MYTLKHKKKFIQSVSGEFLSGSEKLLRENHRGITRVVDSIQLLPTLLLSSPPPSLTLNFKHTHTGCTPCWATSHVSIILKAVTA